MKFGMEEKWEKKFLFLFPFLSLFFLRRKRRGKKERKSKRRKEKKEEKTKRLVIQPIFGGITSHRRNFRVLEEVLSFHAALLGANWFAGNRAKTV